MLQCVRYIVKEQFFQSNPPLLDIESTNDDSVIASNVPLHNGITSDKSTALEGDIVDTNDTVDIADTNDTVDTSVADTNDTVHTSVADTDDTVDTSVKDIGSTMVIC